MLPNNPHNPHNRYGYGTGVANHTPTRTRVVPGPGPGRVTPTRDNPYVGITKAMKETTIKMRSHPTQEGKRSKGTGVGASSEKGTSKKDWGPRVNTYRSSRY